MEKVCFHIHYQTMDAEKRLLNAERDISTAGWPALRQLVSVLHVLRSCLAHQQTCIKKSSNEKLTDVTTLFSLSLPWREAGVEGETGGPQTPSDDSRSLSRMCIWWRCCKKVDVGEVSCLELQSAANPAWRVALGRRPWIWEDYKLLIGRNQWAEGWVLWLPACSGKGWPGQNGWLLRWMRRGKESPHGPFVKLPEEQLTQQIQNHTQSLMSRECWASFFKHTLWSGPAEDTLIIAVTGYSVPAAVCVTFH